MTPVANKWSEDPPLDRPAVPLGPEGAARPSLDENVQRFVRFHGTPRVVA